MNQPVPMPTDHSRCELTDLLVEQCAHCRRIPDPVAPKPWRPESPNSRAKALAMHVEDLMLLMNTNKLKVSRRRQGGTFPLRHYDKAEPYSLLGVTHADVSDDEYFSDATPWDLPTPFDITVANSIACPTDFWGEDFAVRRYRVVKRPYLPLARIARCIVEVSYLALNSRTGEAHSSANYYGMNHPEDRWFELPPQGCEPTGGDEETRILIGLATGIQFTRDYSWRVHLKYNGAEIGVMIPTTPEGIRALFKLRDYEPGASRRKALMTWVTGHSRRIQRDTPDEHLTWVRDHLRGRESFTWEDMRGVIYPSAHDLRRLQEMRVTAKAARRSGRKS
jgi:hypothetical protein